MEFGKILFQRVEVTSKSCQICHTRPLCTVCDIFEATGGILLWFKLGWKLYISSFPTIYGMLSNLSQKKVNDMF
jgi:hypothetical protein